MKTILGANGVIGKELSIQLIKYTDQIRQVSRHPKKVNAGDSMMTADLLNYEDVRRAAAGSESSNWHSASKPHPMRRGLRKPCIGSMHTAC